VNAARGITTKIWRPDWTWRIRQASCLLFVVWFGGVVPLAGIAFLIDRKLVGWVVGGWFLTLLVFVIVMAWLDTRLTREWHRVAARRGWKMVQSWPELAERWPFRPFDIGAEVEVIDVATGTHRDRVFYAGLFRYLVGGTRLGFCFVDIQIDRPLPPMQIAPESLTGLVAPSLRPMDLHLENEEFNRRFRLYRGQRDLVHAVLNPRAMQAMLTVQPFGFVTHGDRFVLLTPGYKRPQTVIEQLDIGIDVIELIPEHIWDEGASWRWDDPVT
jgi:hypothetical protein